MNSPTMSLCKQAENAIENNILHKASLLYMISTMNSFSSVKFLCDVVNRKETALKHIEECGQNDCVVKCLSFLIPSEESKYSALLNAFIELQGECYIFSFISGASEDVQKYLDLKKVGKILRRS